MSFVAESGREPAGIEVSSARTVLVDHPVVSEFRPAELVQFREPAHGYVFQNDSKKVVEIWRAAGKIDDRFSFDHRIQSDCACRIRIGGWTSAPRGTGAYGDYRRRLRCNFLDHLNGRPA